VLLIEGPDMVGKTTMVDRLCEVLDACYDWEGTPVRRQKFGLEESHHMLRSCEDRLKPWTVYDRGYVSEIVYGSRCRPKPRVTPREVQLINGMRDGCRGMTVVVHASDDVYERLIAEHHDRGEDFSREQCRDVNKAYRHVAQAHSLGSFDDIPVDEQYVLEEYRGEVLYPAAHAILVSRIAAAYATRQGAREITPPDRFVRAS